MLADHWYTRVVAFKGKTMMTSLNGNILRVTGHVCVELTGLQSPPVTRSFDVFFDLRLNKRLSKQS